jgi:hypothetical protein
MEANINFSRYSHEWITLEKQITLAFCERNTTLMKPIKICFVAMDGLPNIRNTTESAKSN